MLSWFKKCMIPHECNEYQPHFLRIHAFLVFISFIISIEILFLVQAFVILPGFNLPGMEFLSSIISSALIDNTNTSRIDNNLPLLTVNTELALAAQAKADDMATKGYFAHNGPDGTVPWDWIEEAGYGYVYAGENLAINFYDSEDVVDAWMESVGHRENILSGNFTEIGIGISKGTYEGEETTFVVQLFGKPEPVLAIAKEEIGDLAPKEFIDDTFVVTSEVTETVSTISPVISAEVKGVETTQIVNGKLSFFDKLLASPKSVMNIIYLTIFTIISLALILNIFIKIKVQHSSLVINGISLLLTIAFVLALNQYLLTSNLQIL